MLGLIAVGVMSNLFIRLSDAFGTEDFFTSTLALFLERNEALRAAFFEWLADAGVESLKGVDWRIEIQSSCPSRYGTAILDMRLKSAELELWFEHKVGATLNRYETAIGDSVDQLEKYLDAAARWMLGVTTGDGGVDWPQQPSPGRPRVILLYLSRDGKAFDRSKYSPRIYAPGGSGLVFPDAGQLRWRDFWPIASNVLEPTLCGENGGYEQRLADEFLKYWQSIPRMWRRDISDKTWSELLPAEGDAPFAQLWEPFETLAVLSMGWDRPTPYRGSWLTFLLPHGPVDQVILHAHRRVDELPVSAPELGDQVIQIRFRARGSDDGWPEFPKSLPYEDWRAETLEGRDGQKRFVRLFVTVAGWGAASSPAMQQEAVTQTITAGIRMFEEVAEVGILGSDML